MPLPVVEDAFTLNFAFRGQPYCDIPTKYEVRLPTMDWVFAAQPFVTEYTYDTAWVEGVEYNIGDTVLHNGFSYQATQDHTSSATNEPGVGEDWQLFWEVLSSGDVYYICNIDRYDNPTYNYYGYAQVGTTKWYIIRINRGNMTRNYVTGDGDYYDAWDNRTTYTFGTP